MVMSAAELCDSSVDLGGAGPYPCNREPGHEPPHEGCGMRWTRPGEKRVEGAPVAYPAFIADSAVVEAVADAQARGVSVERIAAAIEGADVVSEMRDVHTWFGLSYSNYAVLPRTLMQSMPGEWQHRMVTCLEELRAAYRHVEQAPGYEVNAVDWKYVGELSDGEMTLTGVTLDWNEAQQESVYYDRGGNEIDAHVGKVAVPAHEPIPHYNRGRTHIPPGARS